MKFAILVSALVLASPTAGCMADAEGDEDVGFESDAYTKDRRVSVSGCGRAATARQAQPTGRGSEVLSPGSALSILVPTFGQKELLLSVRTPRGSLGLEHAFPAFMDGTRSSIPMASSWTHIPFPPGDRPAYTRITLRNESPVSRALQWEFRCILPPSHYRQ